MTKVQFLIFYQCLIGEIASFCYQKNRCLNKINDGDGGLILTSNDKTELQKKLKEDNLLVVP